MFPGHGTPTAIIFGQASKPDLTSEVLVSAILPGGGDLRTIPEESSLWQTLQEHHDQGGYKDSRIVVSNQPYAEVARWPWRFIKTENDSTAGHTTLEAFCSEPIGAQFITGKDELYVFPPEYCRRIAVPVEYVKAYATGEDIRNWGVLSKELILFPYSSDFRPLNEPLPTSLSYLLSPFKSALENVVISGSIKKKETKLRWFEYR